MADIQLKAISADEVTFAEATPAQRDLAWELNGVSWAPPMTVPVYVERETALSQSALSGNGRCRYFVVFRTSDPSDIVSSCEATEKTVFIRDPDSSSAGTVREATAFSIASVYTNPAYRARGMASLMLRKLQAYMDDEAGAACSALYSDIGKVYYARLGWAVFPSLQVSLCIDTPPSADQKPAAPVLPDGVRFLSRDEVPALCDRDVASVRDRLANSPAQTTGQSADVTRIAFAPTAAQIDWHFTRDGFMARALLDREVIHRGAIIEEGLGGWVLWDHDLREKKLKVVRLVVGPGLPQDRIQVTARLLLASVAEAADWNLQKVLVWNPDEDMTAAAKAVGDVAERNVRVVFDERLDGSIPSLRWRESEGKTAEATVWEDNEYYAWC